MPSGAWSTKRERQYGHIKNGLRQRGETEEVAEEIAARTVNKERGEKWRIEGGQSLLHRRYLFGSARWAPVPSRTGSSDAGPTLRRGQTAWH